MCGADNRMFAIEVANPNEELPEEANIEQIQDDPVEQPDEPEFPEVFDPNIPCFTFNETTSRLQLLVPYQHYREMTLEDFKAYFASKLSDILEDYPDLVAATNATTVQARAIIENGLTICPCCLTLMPEGFVFPMETPNREGLNESAKLEDVIAREPDVWPGYVVHGFWVPFAHYPTH